ncbi:MAG TPA: hypothetical protein VM940_03470 [Chthoniobacterales bacterium]|jgi:hypothetical protein|nr:hypothetical protein [Chthoniobacterales bacterium]
MKTAVAVLILTIAFAATGPSAEEPQLTDVVDFSKLLPILPNAPADWTADKPEGDTQDVGGTKITSVHRDYKKGDSDTAPTTSISILDSAANPEYVASTTAAWNMSTSTAEGYTKTLTVEGMPGFETFENEGKHGTLWLMVAKRYVLTIETQNQESKELQEWLKRVDIKKLAEVK